MLFNSYAFLFIFLPAAILSYRLVDPYPNWRVPCLLVLSFAFYGYWDPRFLALLAASILINWIAARWYFATRSSGIVIAAIGVNLAVLGYVKYGYFFTSNLASLTGVSIGIADIALPLGISFFTFHHIMYLVDLHRGRAPAYPLGKYALYICFFPQVLSGPLVRWSEVMDQFGRAAIAEGWERRCATAATLIILGLAQKTFLADPLAVTVDPLFQIAENEPLRDGSAWIAVLGFTFQIFFDFSSYSDIAIGTALIFNIQLPLNFDGPYRATSVREFWRRWHMTLSRFLRDYLYIPHGGNRHGFARQLLAILITMSLGGLWHGAGWGFVFWGVIHGCAIAVAAVWNRMNWPMPAPAGWLLTFCFVSLSWVFFRSASIEGAMHMLEGLAVFPARRGGWLTIAIAAFCAIVLPPTHVIVRRFTAVARPSIAVGLATLGIAVVAQLGRAENHEFIYFRF